MTGVEARVLALEPELPTVNLPLDGPEPGVEVWSYRESPAQLGLTAGKLELVTDDGDPPPEPAARHAARDEGLIPVDPSAYASLQLAPLGCGAVEVIRVTTDQRSRSMMYARPLGEDGALFSSSADEEKPTVFIEVVGTATRSYTDRDMGIDEPLTGLSAPRAAGGLWFLGRRGGLFIRDPSGQFSRALPASPLPTTKLIVGFVADEQPGGTVFYTLDTTPAVGRRGIGDTGWTDLLFPVLEDVLCDVAGVKLEGRATFDLEGPGRLRVSVRTPRLWHFSANTWSSTPFVLPRGGVSVACGGRIFPRDGRSEIAVVRRSLDTILMEDRAMGWSEIFQESSLDPRSGFSGPGVLAIGGTIEPNTGFMNLVTQRPYPGTRPALCLLTRDLGIVPRAGVVHPDRLIIAGGGFSGEDNRIVVLRWTTRPD